MFIRDSNRRPAVVMGLCAFVTLAVLAVDFLGPAQLSAPLNDAVKWRTDRKGMDVLDSPLTVVSGNGVVTLKDKQDVKDALICQGCAK